MMFKLQIAPLFPYVEYLCQTGHSINCQMYEITIHTKVLVITLTTLKGGLSQEKKKTFEENR